MRYAMLIEYHGKYFSGWQIQPSLRTVQGEIERALKIVLREEIRIYGAGRTDAGVHALGQVASFSATDEIQPGRLLLSLNGVLPRDISVVSIARTEEGFHARYSARSKVYEYYLLNRRGRPAVLSDTVYHYHFDLDFDEIKKGIAYLNGIRDFSTFRAADNDCKGDVRDISISLDEREPHLYVFSFKGKAFYKNMIRIIIGTLLRLGRKNINYERFCEIAKSGERRMAFETAPPHGLILKQVIYEPGLNWEV